MTNPFNGVDPAQFHLATDLQPVTPDDAADLPVPGLLYVETGGAVVIDTWKGSAPRTVTVADNQLLPVAVKRVRLTGTTASGIHVLVLI